jgi:hypothetical protein
MLDQAKDNLRQCFAVAGVLERFDETLILMKRRLGWTKDIEYWRKNSNSERPPLDAVPLATRRAILRWNELDGELYCFANSMMDEMVASQDDSFFHEVRQLQTRQNAFLAGAQKTLL